MTRGGLHEQRPTHERPRGNLGRGDGRSSVRLGRLDSLLEKAELDAVLVISKQNFQYLLGGYRYYLYSTMNAHGCSRYLPCLVFIKGRPRHTV